MTASFAGKRVLVTGGSRGIGAAVAVGFAGAGARVALSYRENAEAADAVLRRLAGEGHLAFRADVADARQVETLVAQAIEALGALDVVVNNAGVFHAHPIASVALGDWQTAWRETLLTNLVGPANVSYLAAQHMMGRGTGAIVNVSSRGAFRGEPDAPAYGASKAGLNALTQSLAVALAPHGVFVAAVAPGFVATDMAAGVLEGAGGDEIRGQSPLGRVGTPEEVANAVLFLAGGEVPYATGAIIDVNGASYLRS